jgi:Lipase (class 3)
MVASCKTFPPFGMVSAALLHPYKMSKEYGDYDGSDIDEKNEQNLLKEIYITGHSMGGAMALLAGLDLKSDHQQIWDKVRGIYTYGQPMGIGEAYDVTCQNMIGDRLFQHIYYNDLVPHLPPLNTGAYDHVGAEYRFFPNHNHHHGAKGWILRDDYNFRHGIQFKPQATQVFCILLTAVVGVFDYILSNRQWLNAVKLPWSLADHSPTLYVEAFHRVQQQEAVARDEKQQLLLQQQSSKMCSSSRFVAALPGTDSFLLSVYLDTPLLPSLSEIKTSSLL